MPPHIHTESVSVPYEITLLSNGSNVMNIQSLVSVPYEITLLSNWHAHIVVFNDVSVPYEITLLSNNQAILRKTGMFQYLMKLHYSQTYGTGIQRLQSFSTL